MALFAEFVTGEIAKIARPSLDRLNSAGKGGGWVNSANEVAPVAPQTGNGK